MKDLIEALNRAHQLDNISSRKLKESMNSQESWTDYAARRLDEDPDDFLEEMFAKFVEEAYTLVEAEGYTDVFTEPSTQAGRGGDFFWAEKDGVSYRGNYDFETEQEEIGDCCLNADSEEEAIELCAKKYASIILSSLKPEVDESLTEEEVGTRSSFETNVAKIRDILRKYRNSVRTYDFFGMPQGSKSLPIIYTNKGVKGTTIKACYPDKHFSKDQINKIEHDLRNFIGEDSTIHFDVYDDAWIQGLHTRGYQITVRLQKSQPVVGDLDEAAGMNRNAIKVRIKELINQVDWSRLDAMIEQHDAHQPEIQKTKTLPNGLRVDVYLGWDYGSKLGYKEYEAQVARAKFDAFRAVVEKNEPSWSIKFAKSYGSRGVSWTNYWAQITVGDSASELDEAAFSGGMAGDNSASGGTIRGRSASTQPGKNNYLNRMKSKNPDLVDTMVIKVSDIKPGMITQAGQVKEAEARNHPGGGKKMYIMHTNGYDGFWSLDETMDVMVDPENKSKPFSGDYRSLLKMGLQESVNRAHKLDEGVGDEFYRDAEKELENHFKCSGAVLEPSILAGSGRTFLYADDMQFNGSFDFETGEEYINNDDFLGFLRLCIDSFEPVVDNASADKHTKTRVLDPDTIEKRRAAARKFWYGEALNRAHKLDESNQDYRWFFIGEFKTPERNYVGLWSNLTSKLYVITSDNRIPAQDKKNWMFETTDYNAAKAKLDEIAPQKTYPTGSEVTSLSDIQQFAGCDDFDWTDCTSNLKRTEKQKVLNIVTNNFTLPDGIIRVEWPITAQRIAETLRLHYKNVEVDNNYRVGYHKESAIFYDTPIQGSLDEDDEELKEDVVAKDFNSAKMQGIAEFKKLILSNKVKPFGDNSYCFGEGSTVDRVGGNLDRKTNTINAWYRTKVYGKNEDFDKSRVDQQEATLRKVLESEGWTIDKFNVCTYSTKTFGRSATAGEVIIEANKLVNIDAGASSMNFESIIINAYNSASEWGQKYFNEWQTFVSCVSRSSEYKPSLTNTWIVPWVRVLTDDFKAPTIQFKTTTAASAERIAKVLKQYYPSVAVHHNRWYRGYLDSIIIATNEGNIELDVDPNYKKDIRPGHGTLNVANLKIGGKEIGRIN